MIPPLLREKLFRRYWTGQTISLFCDQISALALPLLAVLSTDAGPVEMGYLTAAALVPNLLFSLLAGAWVDRLPHKRIIMIVADIGRAALLSWIPISYAVGTLDLTQLYVIAFLTGTLSVLSEVSRTTLFVALVDRSSFIDANALLNGSRAMSFVAGPSVGGVLVQVLSAPFALIADAVSYLCSAVLLGRINPLEPKLPAIGGWVSPTAWAISGARFPCAACSSRRRPSTSSTTCSARCSFFTRAIGCT